jgi:hypothetical protein
MNLTLNPGIKALGVHETASNNLKISQTRYKSILKSPQQPVKKRITSNSEDWG